MNLRTSILAVWLVSWCLFGAALSFKTPPLDIALQQARHETIADLGHFPGYISSLSEHSVWKNFSAILRSYEAVEQPLVRDAVLGGLWLCFCLQFLAELLLGRSEKNKRSKNCLLLALLLSVQRYPTLKLSASSNAEETQCPAEDPAATFYGIAFKVCPSPAFVEIEKSNRLTLPAQSYFQQIKSLVAAISWTSNHLENTVTVDGNNNRFPPSGKILPYPFEPQTNNSFVIFVAHDSQEVINSMPNIEKFMAVVPVSQDSLGLQQISDWILKNPTPSFIHIISHGSPGSIALGSVPITTETLLQQDFSSISSVLLTSTDLFIYGCNVAEGETGATLLKTLRSSLGGQTVSASTNQTGSITKGGDWILESVVGDTASQSSPLMAPDYKDLLPVLTCTTGSAIEVGSTGYSTLQLAFAAINAGTHTGAIVIKVCGDTTETSTAVLNASGSGSASYTSITINPVGGLARTISGAITGGSPLIDFNGADNVAIDGLNSGGNSLTISNTSVSNTAGTSTIRFQADATTNTITNASILGSATMATGIDGGTIWFGAAAITSGNDNNTVSNCNIGPAGANLPSKAIYFSGTSNTDPGTANSGITINNNNIFNYFSATVSSAGIDLNSGSVGTVISNNRFYQTSPCTMTTTNQRHSGIWINNSNGNNYSISGNTIGFANSAGTGTYTLTLPASITGGFTPIQLAVGTGAATSVQGNTISGISVSGNASGVGSNSPFRAIVVVVGLANIGTVTGNNIGNLLTTNDITFASASTSATEIYLLHYFGSSNVNISNNSFGSVLVGNTSTGAVAVGAIFIGGNLSPSVTISNNIIGGTVSNSIQNTVTSGPNSLVFGIVPFSNSIVSGNTIQNLTGASPSLIAGIYFAQTNVNHTVSGNTVRFLSNTHSTAAVVLTGLYFTSSTGTNLVEKNLIYGFSCISNSASAQINGINVAGGTCTYRNNMIIVGAGIANSIGGGVSGILEAGGTNNFYHNSVYVGGSPTAGIGNSFAFRSTVTSNTRNYRDNIFSNSRSNSGASGKNYSITVAGTASNPAGLTINNNIYYANGSGGVFGLFNNVNIGSLSSWQAGVGQDAQSIYSNPQYSNPTGSPPDLHLSSSIATPAESSGIDVGVVDDFDGQTRTSLTPVDIGADAGNYLNGDVVAPQSSYALLASANTANYTLSVVITDVSGVATGGNAPRLYFAKNGGSYFSTACTLSTGTATNGTWSCTTDYSLLGGVVAGNIINYFIVAQDTLGNLGSNPSGGFAGSSVNSVTSPPTNLNSYFITGLISGIKTVCASGCDFTTLTGAIGIFAAINYSVLNGNLQIQIAGDLIVGEDGSVALNAITEQPAGSNFTIKIYPTGSARAITGSSAASLIKLNGADRVTIDGSINGTGTDKSLTITNTNPGTSSAVIWIASVSAADGATNNTIKNCNVAGNAPTTTLYCVVSSSGASLGGNAQFANSNNTYQNNSITSCQYGIAIVGPTGNETGNAISGNTIGSAIPASKIGLVGVLASNQANCIISNNAITGVVTSTTSTASGIQIMGTTNGTTITRNSISDVKNTNTNQYGANGIQLNSNSTSANISVTNNVITDVSGLGFAGTGLADNGYGIILVSGGGYNIYYNSVNLATSQTSASGYHMAINILSGITTSASINIRDNVFAISSTVGNRYAIYCAASNTIFSAINYNDYYAPGGGILGYIASTNQTTLAAIQTSFGGNANSISVAPLFTSATNLLLTTGSPLCSAGTPIGGITTDIISINRSATTPSIGAYECCIDTQNPIISCPGNKTQNTDAGVCNSVVTYSAVSATDDCTALPAITQTAGKSSNSQFPLGPTKNTFQAKDQANKTATCSFTVTVNDGQAPTASCKLTNTVNLTSSIGGTYTMLYADVDNGSADNCAINSKTFSPATVSCNDLGTPVNVVLTLGDTATPANTSTCHTSITVKDVTAPTAQCLTGSINADLSSIAPGKVSVTVKQIDNGSFDNCKLANGSPSILPSDFTCDDIGSPTVTLTATDTSNNTDTCTRLVNVRDVTRPVAKCKSLSPITLDPTGNYFLQGSDVDNGSFDNCPANLKITVVPLHMTCFYTSSPVSVTLTADDQHTTPVTCTANVQVLDRTPPIPVCQDITVQLNSAGTAVLAPSTVGGGSSDTCGVQSLALSRTNFSCTDVGASISVTMTVTDVNGNTNTCTAKVTVQDKVPPALVCQNINLTLSSASPSITISPSQLVNSSFDACGSVSYSASNTIFDCSKLGNNSVTVTVTDVNGNTSTCISVVTVTATCVGLTCGSANVCNVKCGNPCDDGNPCNGIESCNASNICVSTPVLCGNGCLPGSGCLSQCKINTDCTPFTCIGGFCKGLSFIGGKCDVGDNSDCVPPYQCSTYSDTVGNYVCGGMGAVCNNNQDQNCKSPLVCLQKTCQYPLPSGSACVEAADCQHGQCIGVCSTTRRRCYDVSECPGGSCNGVCGGSKPWP